MCYFATNSGLYLVVTHYLPQALYTKVKSSHTQGPTSSVVIIVSTKLKLHGGCPLFFICYVLVLSPYPHLLFLLASIVFFSRTVVTVIIICFVLGVYSPTLGGLGCFSLHFVFLLLSFISRPTSQTLQVKSHLDCDP